MAVPSRINNHYQEMVDNLPTQFLDKQNIDGLVATWAEEVQILEDNYWSIYDNTKFLEADGVNLDRYGLLVGIQRPAGMSDDDFFVLVSSEIIARSSDATVDSIRRKIEAVMGLYDTNVIEINNTIVWRNTGYPKLTGDVMVYGYFNLRDRPLSGFEGDLLKRACPVTTEKAIFGQHIRFSDTENNLFIPCEIILSPDKVGVESPTGNPLDELVTDAVGTDNIAVASDNFSAFGDNYELAILPEDSSGGGVFGVNAGEGYEDLNVETETEGVEVFAVQTEGIETNHGVMLEISTSN